MTAGRRGIQEILSTLTVAVLFLMILILVVFSARAYRQSTQIQTDNNRARAVLSYVVTAVRQDDTGHVEIGSYFDAPGVAIVDDAIGFEQRIYMKNGHLMEAYCLTGETQEPSDALVIGDTDTFDLRFIREGLLEIRTDWGTAYVHTQRQP